MSNKTGFWVTLSHVNAVTDMLSALPPQMRDPVLFAVPFFLLLLVLEWVRALGAIGCLLNL